MEEIFPIEDEFLLKLIKIIEENYKDEEFGVSELAERMGINRVVLYRKVKLKSNKSASKFICEYRLKKAMEILQTHTGTISKVALDVGFGSVSYFIKCFHDYFGFPPGDIVRNTSGFNYIGFGKSILRRLFFRIKLILIFEIVLFLLIVLLFFLHKF